eukprot:9479894-Pyramimonas_sp.AAC.1
MSGENCKAPPGRRVTAQLSQCPNHGQDGSNSADRGKSGSPSSAIWSRLRFASSRAHASASPASCTLAGSPACGRSASTVSTSMNVGVMSAGSANVPISHDRSPAACTSEAHSAPLGAGSANVPISHGPSPAACTS